MPLEMLAIMVVLGLALAIGAVHLSGLSHPAHIEDATQAAARFGEDFPERNVMDCLITEDRRAAFLKLEGGGIGLVAAMGDRFITRLLDGAAMAGHTRPQPDEIDLEFRDFTYPSGAYGFGSAEEADRLAGWLEEVAA